MQTSLRPAAASPRPGRRPRRVLPTALATLAVLASSILMVALPRPLGSSPYLVLCAAAVVVLVRGAVTASRTPATSVTSAPCWWALAVGSALWLVSDVMVLSGVDVVGSGLTAPAVLVFLTSYAALATGLLLLTRRASAGRRAAAGIDGAIASTALAVLGLVVVVAPALAAGEEQFPTGVAFLVGDVVLVALAVRVLAVQRRVPATHVAAAGGYLLLLVGDAAWLLDGSVQVLPVITAGVLVSALAWASAAHSERARLLTGPPEEGAQPVGLGHRPSRARTAAMLVAVCLPSAVVAVVIAPWPAGWGPARPTWLLWAALGAGVLMMTLVVARMALSVSAAHESAAESERLRRELEHRATHDALTGVAGRAHLLDSLAAALRGAAADGRGVAVLFVDLDGFKAVNDALGHRAGDAVLRAVASRLQGCLDERGGTGTVGRLGGDEFAVVLDGDGADGADDVVALAHRVVEVVGRPVPLDGHDDVAVGASVGVALSGLRDLDAEELLHEADTAAYRAKATGRGRAVLHDDDLRRELAAQDAALGRLRAAAADEEGGGELSHLFRPVVHPASGQVVAVRAVLRWSASADGSGGVPEDPTRVHDASLARHLARWSLRAAARQQAAWSQVVGSRAAPVVAVPVSVRHLLHPCAAVDVLEAVTGAGARADRLALVVDETELLTEPEVLPVLRHLGDAGVQVCVDGVGWAGVGAMRTLACDAVQLGPHVSEELVAFAVRAARECGATVVVDGGGAAATSPAAEGTVVLRALGEEGLLRAGEVTAALTDALTDALLARRRSGAVPAVR